MDNNHLGTFEGRTVTKTTIAVVNAGDGLSKKMAIEPTLMRQGKKVFVVLECEVGKVTFDPYDDGVCARVQTLKAGTATILDHKVVRDAIAEQADANRRAELAAKGWTTVEEQIAVAEHEDGKHVRLRKDCPLCQKERELDEAGE